MADRTIERVSKVARWDHSLGLRLPQEGVDRLKLKEGDSLKVRINDDTITISRTETRRKWTEQQLLRGITPSMCGPDLIPDRIGRELI